LDALQDVDNWKRVTQEYLDYMAESYTTGLMQSMIEPAAVRHTRSLPMRTGSYEFKTQFIIVQYAIPVRNCNTIQLLEAAVTIAESQGSALLFKSEVVAAVTDLHWSLYGRDDHIFSLVMYVVLLSLFTLLIVMFDTWATTSDDVMIVAWTLQGIKCIFTLYFVWQESLELKHAKLNWFYDAWNWLDATAYILICVGVIVQASSGRKHPAHNKAANVINAIAAVLLWFKLLHYMRPYKATGVLVSMIFKILMKIRAFMLVLAVVVLGFATAFTVYSVSKALMTH
jgi:Ion transport protein